MDRAAEWRRPLTGFVLGVLAFEVLTGLLIYLLGFSIFNQIGVLLHTAVGIVTLPPIVWYLVDHWLKRYRGRFNHFQLLGYVSLAVFLVLVVTGLVLTWQALFGTRIGKTWDLIHIVAGFVFIGALGAHLATLVVRRSSNEMVRRELGRAYRACSLRTLAWGGGLTGACAVLTLAYHADKFDQAFPESYSFKYGIDRPFAPSLARKDMEEVEQALRDRIASVLDEPHRGTFLAGLRADPTEHVGIVTVAERLCSEMDLGEKRNAVIAAALADARARFRNEGMIHPRLLAGSAGCGTSGCHNEILAEWEPSGHRYSSMDFVFQKVQENMARELAPEATRYCAGCHDPIALFSGSKNVGNVTLSAEGADEGVSCLVCHGMVQTDVRGNADYTIRAPGRYLFELREGGWAKAISDFLIRAYPRYHVASYSRPLYKTAEACGACHKQFVDEELNDIGWVQGQNQYDSWRKSRWHTEGDPAQTIGCRECHMPLVVSTDPAAGDVDDPNRSAADGRHRSHRFLAANQFVPRHHQLPGAEEHCALTVQWLRGEYEVPEIADRWTGGPVIRLAVSAPESVHPGQPVSIQTILTNNKAGHDFPTGPLDMIEAWVEVVVTDEEGNKVFASGKPDGRGYLENPQIVFKAELIDRLGDLIGRHELWNTVGARFKRALFPGFTDTTEFVFECPAMPASSDRKLELEARKDHSFTVPPEMDGTKLVVRATLWYCKFSAPFLDRLFGPEAKLRSETTAIAEAEAVIRVVPDEQVAIHASFPGQG